MPKAKKIDTNFDAHNPWSLKAAYKIACVTETIHNPSITLIGGNIVHLHRLGNRQYMIAVTDMQPGGGGLLRFGILDYDGYDKTFDDITRYRVDNYEYVEALYDCIDKYAHYDSDSQKQKIERGYPEKYGYF